MPLTSARQHSSDDTAGSRVRRQAKVAGTLLGEVELAAAGVPWAQAVLLAHVLQQPFRLYREG